MKAIKSILLLVIAISFIHCAENIENNAENTDVDSATISDGEDATDIEAPEEVIDTVPVTVVLLKIMGKESMLQGYFKEGETQEEFIRTHSEEEDFQKLINVDVKGSPFGQDSLEGFKEDETGAILSKTDVYNMLYIDKEEVEQPFRISVVTKVNDFKSWKWLYDAQEKHRQNAGMRQLQLGVNKDDPNEVFLLIAIPDIAKAREMMEHDGLDRKMEESGVIGEPLVKFWRPAGPQSEEL